jgi:hypothetical protein
MSNNSKLLQQMELFDEISVAGLSPNQFYLLCCIHDSITPLRINLHLELRYLINEGWLTKENQLAPKSTDLIQKIETYFSLKKKRTSKQLMGEEFSKNILKYREMFPNKKLPSGKAARCSPGNLEKAFRWFFENYNYSWDIIFKATAHYVNTQQKSGDKYMRTSQYFIRKDDLSDLANVCDAIEHNGLQEEKNSLNVKVV